MPDNIKYEKGKVNSSVAGLRQSIRQLLTEKANDYDDVNNILSISKGDAIVALQQQLMAEKRVILAISDFYNLLLDMIHNASLDIDRVEEHYGQSHMSNGGTS